MKKIWVLDERNVWWDDLESTGREYGYKATRIYNGHEAGDEGVGFIRTHALPNVLKKNQNEDDPAMREHLLMIQDRAQVEVYENKTEQWRRWGQWYPPTWHFTDKDEAIEFVRQYDGKLVSKADVGASSKNVRWLTSAAAAEEHVRKIFEEGIEVLHCGGTPGGHKGPGVSIQNDYVLLQKGIDHDRTWRVNIIGDCMAVFMRYCYKDKMVAQTGNTDPVVKMTPQVESLLEYARQVNQDVQSKWVALDILQDGDDWRLIETSLAWPAGSRTAGGCDVSKIWGSDYDWSGIWNVMYEELERGAWSTP